MEMSLVEGRKMRLVYFEGISDVDLSDLISNGIAECRERFGDLTTLANLELQAEAIRLDVLGVSRRIAATVAEGGDN